MSAIAMPALTLPQTSLVLLPEKAAYLPDTAALLVADVHLGKSETFQRSGIPIPSQVNQATLERLQRASDRTGARQLFILGDLFHAAAGLVDDVIEAWLLFLHQTQLEAHLILGNHDRPLATALSQLSLTCHTQPLQLSSCVLSHEPLAQATGINVCGHLHPCIQVGGRGDRLRLPCFYWETQLHRLTLPSFGEFTGGYEVALHRQAIAYVVAEDTIIPFSGHR